MKKATENKPFEKEQDVTNARFQPEGGRLSMSAAKAAVRRISSSCAILAVDVSRLRQARKRKATNISAIATRNGAFVETA
ncbi:hypothetical protein [Geobacillus sp. TFV-3]|uniref:hypothetical protein n=1 Tax=Geobacillus sp. TFV-3 TaxID=1897059 RepID=UPI001917A25D|nr:hypothetical protein [Geobacillus sp. TFV-3]